MAKNIELILSVGQIGPGAEEIVDIDDVVHRRANLIDVGHAPVAIKFCSIAKRRYVPKNEPAPAGGRWPSGRAHHVYHRNYLIERR